MTGLQQLVRQQQRLLGLTQAAIAQRVGVSSSQLSKVLSGSQRLQTHVAIRLAAEISVDIRQLLEAIR